MSELSLHMVKCACVQKTVQLITKLPTHCNVIGRSMTAPPPVLSPSSILPQPSSCCAFTLVKKNRRAFQSSCYFALSTMLNPLNAELNHICCLLALLGAQHFLHVSRIRVNPLKPELNRICYLLALLGAHHFLHVSRIRVKLLTLR